MSEWKRNCPGCGKELVYKSKFGFTTALKKNSKCVFCSSQNKPKKEKIEEEFKRNCPECKEELIYNNYYNFKIAEEKNTVCHNCAISKRKININTLKRNCPECGIELNYSDSSKYKRAIEDNSYCRLCAGKHRQSGIKDQYINNYDANKKLYFYNCSECNEIIFLTTLRGLKYSLEHKSKCEECRIKPKEIEIFKRNCLNCNKEIIYKNKSNFDLASKNNRLCTSCAHLGHIPINKKYDYEKHFDNITEKYFYNCPECNKIVYVAEKRGLRQALQKECKCRECRNKDPKVRENLSNAIKATYADPNSVFNTEEYKQKRTESCYFLTEEGRKASSERMKEMLADPNSKLNIAIQSEEYSKNISEGLKKSWQDPNSKFNSPEFREELSKRAKDMLKLGGKTSKGEMDLSKYLLPFGFIHNNFTIRIKNYYPDIINEKEKIIVEYYGDFYHANPNIIKYKDNNIIVRLPNGTKLAGEIRTKDAIRQEELENLGYKIFIIWENDFQKNKEKTVTKLIEDIKNYINSK